MLTISKLKYLQQVIKLAPVVVAAGLNDRSITSKLKNNRELTVTESISIEKILRRYGFDCDKIESNFIE